MEPHDLPSWIIYLGELFGVIGGALIIRLGWNKSGSNVEPPEPARIMGAIVDSASVREHTMAMESHTEVMKVGFGYVETLNGEMRVLSDEVRRLGNSLRDRD